MLSQWIAQSVTEAAQSLLKDWGEGDCYSNFIVKIEQPASLEYGDYSSSIAMQLAKPLKKPPLHIAELIKAKLVQQGNMRNLLSRIEVLPPGFLNLYINWEEWLVREFELPICPDEKVIIEHTSINPNKSAHIGHLRNSCIGDTLVRLLRRVGYHVEVHNYIDDLGNQLADTVVGLLNIPLSGEYGRFGDYCWDLYATTNKEYTVDSNLARKRIEVLHALENGISNVSWIGMLAAERIVREHIQDMGEFGIKYDLLVWESSIVREGFWSSAFQLLQQTSLFYQETEGKLAGCWVLKQSSEDEVRDSLPQELADHAMEKVLVRSNGILTYTAKDIAYHLWKYGLLERNFSYQPFSEGLWTTHSNGIGKNFGKADSVINVIDYRQEYPQAMVKQALQALGYSKEAEKLRHVSYGVVSLSPSSASRMGIDISDGKSSYAMSGRQGIGIKVSELTNIMENVIQNKRSEPGEISSRDIAVAAIRYYLLRFNLQTEVVFDLQQATEISGNTGVYLLYAYARASSVLKKAKEQSIWPAHSKPVKIASIEPAERALLRHVSSWLDTLFNASQDLTPNTPPTCYFV